MKKRIVAKLTTVKTSTISRINSRRSRQTPVRCSFGRGGDSTAGGVCGTGKISREESLNIYLLVACHYYTSPVRAFTIQQFASDLRIAYNPDMKNRTDIRTEIARLRRERAEAPAREAQEELAAILDGLNVMGALENLRHQRFNRYLANGPKAVFGCSLFPWVGAVIWHRPSGYYGFKELTIYGAWAFREIAESNPSIVIGTKHVPYAVDFFEAETFMKLMKRDFSTYYKDDGSPPSRENWSWSAIYDAAERLTQRAQLAQALAQFV